MLRSNARVVQATKNVEIEFTIFSQGLLINDDVSPGTDGMRVNDLPLLILQQVAVRAMEDAWGALGQGRGMLLRLYSLPSGLGGGRDANV